MWVDSGSPCLNEPVGTADTLPMFPPQRQRAIAEFLLTVPGRDVSVAEIGRRLGVAVETVRRDLEVLARRGTVRRVRGGARLVDATPFEQALAARHAEQRAEKVAIAERVATELPADGVIALDSGSLTFNCAQAMAKDSHVAVVTNNLPAAQHLAQSSSLTVITLPGLIRGLTSAAVDAATSQRLRTLSVDVAIIGVNGLTPQRGMTTTNPEEAAVKQAMLLSARRRIVPVISGKVGRDSFCAFGALNEVDLIITDSGADPELLAELTAAGPEVIVVEPAAVG